MNSNNSKFDVMELLTNFEEINSMLKDMQEFSSSNFLPLSNKLKDYFKAINNYDEKDTTRNMQMKDCISKIITELQFHDIIRQKLEHIEEIHVELVSEIKQFLRWNNLEQPKYLNILPFLIKLSIAQLEVVNKEFIHAVGILKSKLKEFDLTVADHFINHELSFLSTENFIKSSNYLIDKLYTISEEIAPTPYIRKSKEAYHYIESVYTMESERTIFYKVFDFDTSIAQSNQTISKSNDVDFF